jgi:hypothetical protein
LGLNFLGLVVLASLPQERELIKATNGFSLSKSSTPIQKSFGIAQQTPYSNFGYEIFETVITPAPYTYSNDAHASYFLCHLEHFDQRLYHE